MKKILSLLLVALLVIGMFPVASIHAHAATAGESVKYTFSSYTAGNQYAEETHKLDEEVSLKIVDCHLTTQLRIYDSSSNDGIAIIKSAIPVTAIAFNMGYKKCTLNVYGSNDDGATWDKIGSIATATSYKDYSLDFAEKEYSSIKLDAVGAQIRIATMTLTFAEAEAECNHTYESVVTKPTCTEAGYTTFTCSSCGDSYTGEETQATGHTAVEDSAVDATCTTVGKTAGSHCSVCNEVIVAQEEVPMIDHTYANGACTACGAEDPSVCAHSETTVETVPASCTEVGAENTVCSSCGQIVNTEEIPALGHTEVVDPAVDATCIATGLTEGSHCSVCNEVIVAQTETELADHNYVDGTCTVCGAIVVVIPNYPETGIYQLVTDIANVKNGGKFVIVASVDGVNYALGNTLSNSKLNAVPVDIINGLVYTADAPTWIAGKYGDNIVLKNEDKYLKHSSSTNVSAVNDVFAWTVEVAASTENAFNIKSSLDVDRALSYRGKTYSVFGAYAFSQNNNGEYYSDLQMYELVEGELVVEQSVLSFNENGKITANVEADVNSSYILPEASNAAPEGYTFAGWALEAFGETDIKPETLYAAGEAYKVGQDVTFHAVYIRTEVIEGGTVYMPVTDVSSLKDGDKVIIAASNDNYALSITQAKNNRSAVAITKDGDVLNLNDNVAVLTLTTGTVEGTFAFFCQVNDGYLAAGTGSSNRLYTQDKSDAASFKITLTDGVFSVISQVAGEKNDLRYNYNNGSPLFACYGSDNTMTPVVLYGETVGSSEIVYYTTCDHTGNVVTDEAVDATCTVDGLTEGSHCGNCGKVFVAQEVVKAEHSYGEWVVTVQPTLQVGGQREKTCTVCGDVVTDDINAQQGNVEAWSLTLNDNLSVNFLIYINYYIQQTAQVNITVGDETYSYPVSEATPAEKNNYFLFSASVAAAQMNDTITVQIVNGEDFSVTKTYTVAQYAQTVLADETQSQYHDLVKEMLNYGAAAQTYFDHNADNLASSVIEDTTNVGDAEVPAVADSEMTVSGKVDGIRFYAASLVYNNKVAVRLYFKITGDPASYTFSSGTPVESGEYYYIEIADIDPQNWDDAVTVTVNDTLQVSYSPMNYMVRMSAKDSVSANLKALLKAMYNYHLAAEALQPDAQ